MDQFYFRIAAFVGGITTVVLAIMLAVFIGAGLSDNNRGSAATLIRRITFSVGAWIGINAPFWYAYIALSDRPSYNLAWWGSACWIGGMLTVLVVGLVGRFIRSKV